jgi:hypothetical protein
MSLRESGNVAASNLLHEAAEAIPKRAAKMSLAWKKEKTARETKVYSDEEAISLLVEAQLSKQKYNTTRLQAKTKGCNIYPSYNKVRAAKESSYPDLIIVTEDECEVKLQQLLDHTAKRLLLAQQEVTAAVPAEKTSNLDLVSKWGCELPKKPRGSLHSAVLALLEAPPSLMSGASASTSATVINPSDSEYSGTESELFNSSSVTFISLIFFRNFSYFRLTFIKNMCFKQYQ